MKISTILRLSNSKNWKQALLQQQRRCRVPKQRWLWRRPKRCFLRFYSVTKCLKVNNDPKLKTKAEKDRRLKEKQAANTKKIIDERKSKGMKENKVLLM